MDCTDLISVLIAILALGISGYSVYRVQREKQYSFFLSLWEDYSSSDMFEAMMAMFKLWNDNKGNAKQIAEQYVGEYNKGNTELHGQRRRVSLLFQKLAILYYSKPKLIPREFRKWVGFSLNVIPVLYPIEIDAIPEILKDQPPFQDELELERVEKLAEEGKISKDIPRMVELYNEAKTKKISL